MRTLALFDHFLNEFDHVFDAPRYITRYVENTQAYDDGEKIETYVNGRLHNEKGPAVKYKDSTKQNNNEYWLNGRRSSKDEVDKYREKLEDEAIKYITVEGKEYKVTGKQLKEVNSKVKEILKIT